MLRTPGLSRRGTTAMKGQQWGSGCWAPTAGNSKEKPRGQQQDSSEETGTVHDVTPRSQLTASESDGDKSRQRRGGDTRGATKQLRGARRFLARGWGSDCRAKRRPTHQHSPSPSPAARAASHGRTNTRGLSRVLQRPRAARRGSPSHAAPQGHCPAQVAGPRRAGGRPRAPAPHLRARHRPAPSSVSPRGAIPPPPPRPMGSQRGAGGGQRACAQSIRACALRPRLRRAPPSPPAPGRGAVRACAVRASCPPCPGGGGLPRLRTSLPAPRQQQR